MDLFNGINMFVAWLVGVPVRVCHSHNSQSQYENKTNKHFIVGFYRFIMRKMCWIFSNRRCGCSPEAMDYLFVDQWKDDLNSTIVYNGINIETFNNVNEPREKTCKDLKLTKKHTIITVGRHSEQKNPYFTIKILSALKQMRDDWQFLWVGSGELTENIKQEMNISNLDDNVKLLGTRKDVARLLHCSDVFLLPSIFEGMPIVLVEAQSTGLICVVSDSVSKYSDCGLVEFVSLDKSEEYWAKILSDILDGKIQKQLNMDLLSRYDIKNLANQMIDVYKI